jgi:hypothetical protein
MNKQTQNNKSREREREIMNLYTIYTAYNDDDDDDDEEEVLFINR